MEVKLDDKKIQELTQESINMAIQSALTGFSARQEIEKRIQTNFAEIPFEKMATDAIQKTDWKRITECLAQEIERAVVAGVTRLLEEAMIDITIKIRGTSLYGKELEEFRNKLRQEIYRKNLK